MNETVNGNAIENAIENVKTENEIASRNANENGIENRRRVNREIENASESEIAI